MGIEATFKRVETWLKGWPSGALTCVLLIVAVVLVVIALRATALEKALVASWVILP